MKLFIKIIFLFSLISCAVLGRIRRADNAQILMSFMKNALAGDTIIVAPGIYTGSISESGDPGNLPNGKGYFWVGNDGTTHNPIVIISAQKNNPSVLEGNSLSTGYGVHVTGNYIILKNLIIRNADKGVVFDNASHGIIEDCIIYNSGAELIHVRDSSCHVVISRNKIYSAGNGGRGSIGEGIYIGTDQARWGADDVDESAWGEKAVSEGYGGYDWRVQHTHVRYNYIGGGISAECMDIKEGSSFTLVEGNMLVGDSIGLKPGNESYDDSFIDQKGVKGTFVNNSFCNCGNDISKYISEVTRSKYDHVPDSLTADSHESPWCDSNGVDNNDCSSEQNFIITEPFDPRSAASPVFDFDYGELNNRRAFSQAQSHFNNPFVSSHEVHGKTLIFTLSNRGYKERIFFSLYNTKGQKISSMTQSPSLKRSVYKIDLQANHFAPGFYVLKMVIEGTDTETLYRFALP